MATPAAGDNRRLAIGSSSDSHLKDENLRRQESQNRSAHHPVATSTQYSKSWLQVQLPSVCRAAKGAQSHMLSLVARQALRSLSCLVFGSVCSLCLLQCVCGGYTGKN